MSVGFVDNSEEVLRLFEQATARGLEKIGLTAEGYAKKLAPVGTPESTGIPGYVGGRLRNSITYATNTKHSTGEAPAKPPDYETHGTAEKNSVYLGTNVEYAVYVELGTKITPAQPFLKPAVTEHSGTYRAILEAEYKNG